MASFQHFHPLKFPILVWIGRLPAIFQPQPKSALYVIGLFTTSHKPPDNWATLIDIKLNLHETYLIYGHDTATQLYYKMHDILTPSDQLFHKTFPAVRTNVKYSGTLKTHLRGLITPRSPILEITTGNDEPHRLQIILEYYTVEEKKWYVLVINIHDVGPYRCEHI